mmetsp:Transcript_283/g.622  ORF Transcript_283/g.622 Transcript_283/m.622 type:complete len:336 (-) Transcript_283:130-1137(-)
MAARKSCTHMTWAEAKAKMGEAPITKKKGEKPKKLNHMEKVIAKHGISSDVQAKEKAMRKQEQRQQEKLQAMAEKKALERQRLVAIPTVSAHEEAKKRRREIIDALKENEDDDKVKVKELSSLFNNEIEHDLDAIIENKEMQLSELMALEAIFDESDEFHLRTASDIETLRQCSEEYMMDPDATSLRKKIVQHPPISFLICLDLKDDESIMMSATAAAALDVAAAEELVSSLLLDITLPPYYPSRQMDAHSTPIVNVAFEYATDEKYEVKADKVVESLVHLDEKSLLEDIQKQFDQIQPDFAVYEVCVTWLTENFYNYCTWNKHHPLFAAPQDES